jgi:hypothetical protein
VIIEDSPIGTRASMASGAAWDMREYRISPSGN